MVADGLSRLCHKTEKSTSLNLLYSLSDLDAAVEEDSNFEERSRTYLGVKLVKAASAKLVNVSPIEALRRRRDRPIISNSQPRMIHPEKYKLISSCHNLDIGHWGIGRTMEKVRLKQQRDKACTISVDDYSEADLRMDVANFIERCPCCQKMSQLKPYIHTYKYVTMKYGILEHLAMDTIVGLPTSEKGNEHLLVIVDTFSRYIQLYPLKELTAHSAQLALGKWINTYGKPFSILTDNASQFQAIFKEVLAVMGIDDRKIHPYSHEENSIVEHVNKEVERHLRNIMFHEKVHDLWDEFCPAVERLKNNEICVSTGVSPVELIFGRNVNLDRGHLYPVYQTKNQPQRLSDYIKQQTEIQRITLEVAISTQAATDLKHLGSGSMLGKSEFNIDDYVLVNYENDEHKAPTKFHPIIRGPFRVLSKVSRVEGDIYTVQHLNSIKMEDFHVKLLRPFHHDAQYTNPYEVAAADTQSFTIEKCLKYRWVKGNKKLKSNMEVLVKWKGYEEPTWEPYVNVADVGIFHQYLRDNKLSFLIRDRFKEAVAK